MQALEEQIAHLTRTVEELSDVVANQQSELDRLSKRVRMLMEREAGREQGGGGAHVFGDERPPHY
ncbi:SlyX family protein [Pseudophaeobacter sp. EL27]|uniref:SlyX family protein n=1 Tax=Pseudophaeobacter sp. EL27 TaxID=2107580 RepID=UPI000EFB80A9|nr:SlyX family protein [Pseudophaeobacter sp. EL27]